MAGTVTVLSVLRPRGSAGDDTGLTRAVAHVGMALGCLMLLLSGCTPSGEPRSAATDAPPRSTSEELPLVESGTPPFGGVQGDIPAMAEIANDPELRNHVALTSCERTGDGWVARGTAANPMLDDRAYRLVVIFTDAESRAVTSGTLDVVVPASSEVEWAVQATFDPDDGTRCVLAGVATTDGAD